MEKRAALSVEEFAREAGIGMTKAYEEIGAGRVVARKIGRRTLILRDDMEAFLKALPIAERRPLPRSTGGRQ